MKSLLVGTRHYLCQVYNYHDSQACGYKRSGILFRLDWFEWECDGFGLLFVGSFVITLCPLCICDHTL
jgi:hypothetical protein